MGIAVDSNVVIYERIREELRSGKSIQGSIESGFQKAIRTILDANITNAAAGVVLLTYGNGANQRVCSDFVDWDRHDFFLTAVFVCRLLFDIYLRRLERKANPVLSI